MMLFKSINTVKEVELTKKNQFDLPQKLQGLLESTNPSRCPTHERT